MVCDRTWARGTEARERSRLCGFCDRGVLFGFGLGLAFASQRQFFLASTARRPSWQACQASAAHLPRPDNRLFSDGPLLRRVRSISDEPTVELAQPPSDRLNDSSAPNASARCSKIDIRNTHSALFNEHCGAIMTTELRTAAVPLN